MITTGIGFHDARINCEALALDETCMRRLAISIPRTETAVFIGMPIAFALGAVATLFMIFFMPKGSVKAAEIKGRRLE
jgi:hypothetical protein